MIKTKTSPSADPDKARVAAIQKVLHVAELLKTGFESWATDNGFRVPDRVMSTMRSDLNTLLKEATDGTKLGMRFPESLTGWINALPSAQRDETIKLFINITPRVIFSFPDKKRKIKPLKQEMLERDDFVGMAARAAEEKARISLPDSGKESAMRLTEKQNDASRNSYVPPSRAGKKQLMGYFDEDIIKTLRAIALARDTTLQGLLEEAVSDLMSKHSDDVENVSRFLRDRAP